MIKNLKAIDKNWSLFLDRDGVINLRPENDYVKTPGEFIFIENVPQAMILLNKIFKYSFVVTNQQGIGKGLMTVTDLELIHKTMFDELRKARHAKVAPGTSAWRKIAVGVLLQSWNVVVVFAITGRGFTVSTTFCVIPGGHPLAWGVTW